jgi:apolipoprotein D and lipocalin family protein
MVVEAMRRAFGVVLVGLMASVAAASAAEEDVMLEVVDAVDLDRYLGTWYEIASFPAWFQRDCTAVQAEYTKRDDGLIKVVNSCRKKSLDGKLKKSTGRAKVVDTTSNAKLKVSFFGPFWGNYWIIDLDPDYRWAVVSEPNRKYLWILSRERTMNEALFEMITARLDDRGFELDRLNLTLQPAENVAYEE